MLPQALHALEIKQLHSFHLKLPQPKLPNSYDEDVTAARTFLNARFRSNARVAAERAQHFMELAAEMCKEHKQGGMGQNK